MSNKPLILCIAGKSGSGKTTLAEYFEKVFNIPMIQSYTDRAPRYEGENGHTFVSPSEFDAFKEEDMIAYTKFGDKRYCCLHQDVQPINTYVIDEKGIDWLVDNHSDKYNITTAFIDRPYNMRAEIIEPQRLKRDETMFYKTLEDYDYVVSNFANMKHFESEMHLLYNNWSSQRGFSDRQLELGL